MAEEARIVRLLLEVVKQEFPDYHTNNDSMIAVAVALATVTGAIGAHILLKGGEQRLDKMLRMVTTRADQTARAGVKAIQDNSKRIITGTG